MHGLIFSECLPNLLIVLNSHSGLRKIKQFLHERYITISRDDVLRDRAGLRNLAIYLIKKLMGMTNGQIGGSFGDLSYSAVAKAHQKFSVNLRREKALRKKVETIRANLS